MSNPYARKILALLSRKEKRRLLLLLPLIALVGLFQVFSILSVLPFISVVSQPELIQTNSRLNWLYQTLGFTTTNNFLVFLGGVVLAFIVISNAIIALTNYLQIRFAAGVYQNLSLRLLGRYLYQPYVWFLGRNTAGLNKNILEEVNTFTDGVMVPGMQLLANAVVSSMILLLLLVVDWRLSLVVMCTLGGFYAIVYLAMRKRIKNVGQSKVEANRKKFKITAEAFGGIKDVKLMHKEAVFLGLYAQQSSRFARFKALNTAMQKIPPTALEIIAFGGILVIVLYLLLTRGNLDEAQPLIVLYAFAALRLKPSVQTIFTTSSMLRFNLHSVAELYNDMQQKPSGDQSHASGAGASESGASDVENSGSPESGAALSPVQVPAHLNGQDGKLQAPVTLPPLPKPLPFNQHIALQGLHFKYPDTNQWVINNLSLDIAVNTTIAFVGATGSGKTTLVDIILGLLAPAQGQVLVDGQALNQPANMPRWQQNIGYVPQHIFLTDDTVAHNIAFGVPPAQVNHEAVQQAARVAELHTFVQSLPQGYSTIVGERGVRLSGGQRQRIGIARALYHDPALLVMDEATSALDGITEENIMSAIKRLSGQKTIIMIAHRLSTVQACDHIYFLEHGRIVDQGNYNSLIEGNEQFRAMARAGGPLSS